jgi:hypothetical protein
MFSCSITNLSLLSQENSLIFTDTTNVMTKECVVRVSHIVVLTTLEITLHRRCWNFRVNHHLFNSLQRKSEKQNLKIWFCLKWDFLRSQSLKRQLFSFSLYRRNPSLKQSKNMMKFGNRVGCHKMRKCCSNWWVKRLFWTPLRHFIMVVIAIVVIFYICLW